MIVEASGTATVRIESTASATMIVSTTGTAYVRKGKIKSIIRFIKRCVKPIKEAYVEFFTMYGTPYMVTKDGRATSIDPPPICKY